MCTSHNLVITIVIKSKINPMKIYKKKTVQHVNATVEECWKFFPVGNLQKITPETMGFQITDFDSKPMYAGQIIQYKVTPLWV
jgi:ligand-binding SRPBCC domain-containing protein